MDPLRCSVADGGVLAAALVFSTVVAVVELSGVVLLGVAGVFATSSADGVMDSCEGGVVFFAMFKTCSE